MTTNKILEEIEQIIIAHKKKISDDNGWYDWQLRTPKIENGKADLARTIVLFANNKINQSLFLSALYAYFQIVYDETYRFWKMDVAYWRIKYATKTHYKYKDLPNYDVMLSRKDLAYIEERWNNQQAKENRPIIYEGFDNDIGDIDYPVVTIDTTIRSVETLMPFGKYSRHGQLGKFRNYTIKEVMHIDPQYLLWSIDNVDSFKVSEEILSEIKEWNAHFVSRGYGNKTPVSSKDRQPTRKNAG